MSAVEQAIIANRKQEESAAVAVELFATLGFCHGFRDMSAIDSGAFLMEQRMNWPWPLDSWVECSRAYWRERSDGLEYLASFPEEERVMESILERGAENAAV